MEEYLSIFSKILSIFGASPFAFMITLLIVIITYFYMNGNKKRKIANLFSLDPLLEKQMNNFRSQQTKLYFHFIRLSNNNKTYDSIYLSFLNEMYDIKGNELIIEYIDVTYPFKYNITEEIGLYVGGEEKYFTIVINKYVDNHYNIILDVLDDKKTFSLEIILYSK